MTLQLLVAAKNYSSWSVRPWILMTHFDIKFDEVIAPLFADPEAKRTIFEWSAAGKVPVLRDGDVTVWDSLAIMEYLAEKFPDKPMWPVDSGARAVARSVCAEMHSGFGDVRNEMPMNARGDVPSLAFSDGVQTDVARIQEIWADCRQTHGKDGDFLFGDFTIADAMYAPVVSRFKTYHVALEPAAAAYSQAVLDLPATQRWYDEAAAEHWVVDHYELG